MPRCGKSLNAAKAAVTNAAAGHKTLLLCAEHDVPSTRKLVKRAMRALGIDVEMRIAQDGVFVGPASPEGAPR